MSTMKIYALVRGRALVGGYERYLLQIRSDRSELPSILTVWMDLPEGTNLTEGALYYVRGDCFFDDRGRIFMRVPHTFLVNRTIIPIPLTLFKKVVGPLFNLLGLCRNFIQTEPFSFVMELCVGPSFNATITVYVSGTEAAFRQALGFPAFNSLILVYSAKFAFIERSGRKHFLARCWKILEDRSPLRFGQSGIPLFIVRPSAIAALFSDVYAPHSHPAPSLAIAAPPIPAPTVQPTPNVHVLTGAPNPTLAGHALTVSAHQRSTISTSQSGLAALRAAFPSLRAQTVQGPAPSYSSHGNTDSYTTTSVQHAHQPPFGATLAPAEGPSRTSGRKESAPFNPTGPGQTTTPSLNQNDLARRSIHTSSGMAHPAPAGSGSGGGLPRAPENILFRPSPTNQGSAPPYTQHHPPAFKPTRSPPVVLTQQRLMSAQAVGSSALQQPLPPLAEDIPNALHDIPSAGNGSNTMDAHNGHPPCSEADDASKWTTTDRPLSPESESSISFSHSPRALSPFSSPVIGRSGPNLRTFSSSTAGTSEASGSGAIATQAMGARKRRRSSLDDGEAGEPPAKRVTSIRLIVRKEEHKGRGPAKEK